jgi:tetratricopeptide (TPR) repeat protein
MSSQKKINRNSATCTHDVFILGDAGIVEKIKLALAPLPDLVFKPANLLVEENPSPHIIIGICDFTDVANMQIVARAFHRYDCVSSHKIVYSPSRSDLDQQHLFFSIELGSRFTAYGPNRDYKLKEYIKRTVILSDSDQSYSHMEADITAVKLKGDNDALDEISKQLTKFSQKNESVLRLQAIVSQHLLRINKSVFYLRKILEINPQNLWAANELGRLFLRSNRISEGVEILEKLSQFHDLNSERMLHLGDAYLKANKLPEAENVYAKGHQLVGVGPHDTRFREGIAKVKVAQGDVTSALSILNQAVLSEDVLGFLNMRAVISIRNGQLSDGIRFYQLALDGCREDKIVRSKLFFNMGLAYLKLEDFSRAVDVLKESVELGGTHFTRGQKPLLRAQSYLKKKNAATELKQQEINNLDEIDLDEIS